MEEFIWLDVPLHKNKFSKIDLEGLDGIKMSFDGSIMAVKKKLVEEFYRENKVDMIKAGYEKMPKEISTESLDDLYNILSYYVTL